MTLEKKKKRDVEIILITAVCILMNYFGRMCAVVMELPAWMDTFGTVASAYILGPVSGAVVGVCSNMIYGLWDPMTCVYSITSVFIAVSVGIAAKLGYFNSFFHATSVAGVVTIGSVAISTTIDAFLFKGVVGNIWGEGVKSFLLENNVPFFLSVLIGQFYLDFFDKLVTILAFFFFLKLVKLVRKKLSGKKAVSGKNGIFNSFRKTKNMVFLCILISGAFFSILFEGRSAGAEDEKYVSYIRTIFNGENGLPCGHANAIAQTNDGVLWIGSYAGLYRYNGTEFTFMNQYDAIKNVNCLYVDAEGRLWVGTNDNGVVMIINEKVSNVINTENGLPSDSVRCITQNEDGEYYIGTSNGTAVISLMTGISVVETIPEAGFIVSEDADGEGNVFSVSADGQLFVMSKRQIKNKTSLQEEKKKNNLPSGKNQAEIFTCCVYDGKQECFYLGTSDGDIYRCTGREESGEVVFAPERIRCEEVSKINRLYVKKDGTICICSDNGIGFIRDGQTFVKEETGSFNFQIENMTVDYQGNMWFTSSRLGLLRLTESAFTDIFGEVGLSREVVNTTALWKNLLYVGTDGGLFLIDQKTKKVVENDLTKYFKDIRIRCIKRDSAGNLWFCSYGKGLVCLSDSGKRISYDENESGLGNRVRVCEELSDHTIVVGGENGLSFLKNGIVQQTIPYGEKLGVAKILCFFEKSEGVLYAGTDGNGIVEVTKGKGGWKSAEVTGHIDRENGLGSGVILRMVPDKEKGKAFVVTSNGLSYLEEKKVVPFEHFPYYNNYDVILDPDGEMFVSGSAGIYVVNRDELMEGGEPSYQILNSSMGLMGALTANAWNQTDGLKNIYLSTDRGVFMVNMDEYRMNRRSYRLMVSRVELDEKSFPVERGLKFTVKRDVKKITFIPEIVNYTLENPTVSYYLEGLESKKKVLTQKELSRVSYTNLHAGEYVFHLAIVSDRTGEVIEESTYRFVKEKSIYDNAWFLVYMVVLAVIFVGWFSWFITRTWLQKTIELQQSRLQLAMQQIQMGNETILAIAKTVDAKDERTSQHSQRVSEYSVMIAKEYGFSEEEQENLRRAALLHDIGKIAIPDMILNKPARLTDDEYYIMKTHVTKGAEILKDFTLIDHVVDGAEFHHERYDGRGYPDGLKGEQIPLYGRIIAIADAFDAMTANRVYRQKQDFDYVLSELHKGRGTQFDPKLLDIFLKLIENKTIDIEAIYEEKEHKEETNE